MLKSDFGLKTDLPWQAAFTRMGKNDTDKINELLKRGEDLKNGARIKLATIHGVKGNERDNVVLSFKLSKACKDAYITSPDDEHRVMYTGATRTKNNLHIILGGEGDYDK
jgi:superfamily I DNA/RNA helicase